MPMMGSDARPEQKFKVGGGGGKHPRHSRGTDKQVWSEEKDHQAHVDASGNHLEYATILQGHQTPGKYSLRTTSSSLVPANFNFSACACQKTFITECMATRKEKRLRLLVNQIHIQAN